MTFITHLTDSLRFLRKMGKHVIFWIWKSLYKRHKQKFIKWSRRISSFIIFQYYNCYFNFWAIRFELETSKSMGQCFSCYVTKSPCKTIKNTNTRKRMKKKHGNYSLCFLVLFTLFSVFLLKRLIDVSRKTRLKFVGTIEIHN